MDYNQRRNEVTEHDELVRSVEAAEAYTAKLTPEEVSAMTELDIEASNAIKAVEGLAEKFEKVLQPILAAHGEHPNGRLADLLEHVQAFSGDSDRYGQIFHTLRMIYEGEHDYILG